MENQDRLEPGKEIRIGNLSVHRNWDGGRLFVMATSPLSKVQELVLDKLFIRLPKTAERARQAWVFRDFDLNEKETEDVVIVLCAILKVIASVPTPSDC